MGGSAFPKRNNSTLPLNGLLPIFTVLRVVKAGSLPGTSGRNGNGSKNGSNGSGSTEAETEVTEPTEVAQKRTGSNKLDKHGPWSVDIEPIAL